MEINVDLIEESLGHESQPLTDLIIKEMNNTGKTIQNLIVDSDVMLRCSIAEITSIENLILMVNDEDWRVRVIIAYRGIECLSDILINDSDYSVRIAVMKSSIGDKYYDQLQKDKEFVVREQLAIYGRPVDRIALAKDENERVRYSARTRLMLNNS